MSTDPQPDRLFADASTELSARRTGMSFQRTRLSADRTLMSVIRTSLSLIGFGFTIFQFFQKLHGAGTLNNSMAARHFGQVLVWIGIATLVLGIVYQVLFMIGLRKERDRMAAEKLIYGQSHFPPSMTLIIAMLVLGVGVVAIINMSFNTGPFG